MFGGNTTISKLSLKLNGSCRGHFFACDTHSFPTSLTESGLMGNSLKNKTNKLLYFVVQCDRMSGRYLNKGEKYV